jgi:hypothetical protein
LRESEWKEAWLTMVLAACACVLFSSSLFPSNEKQWVAKPGRFLKKEFYRTKVYIIL